MFINEGLLAVGLIEKDLQGDSLWLWIYPSISIRVKEVIEKKCNIIWDKNDEKSIMSLYVHFNNQWIYLWTGAPDSTDKLCIAIIASDFNPPLYTTLAQEFLKRYVSSTSPVSVLECYLEVFTQGRCTIDETKVLNVKSFDFNHYALTQSKIRDVISTFGIETILIFTAMLLKKRIVVYHPDCSLLADICRSIMLFTYYRSLNWNALFPMVNLYGSEMDELRLISGGYVAGFIDNAVEDRSEMYDLFVNAYSKKIRIAAHARETFAMGKLHKDLATFMIQCLEDAGKSDEQCIKDIAAKTKDLSTNLQTFGVEDENGKLYISAEALREKHLPPATENFLLNLALVEGLLKI